MEDKIKFNYIHGGDIYTDGILKGRDLLDFSSNINPLGVSKSFKEHIGEAVQNVERYPDFKYRKLTENLKEYLKSGYGFDGGNIVVGNGAAEIIDICISLFKRILIVVPSFSEYESDSKKWNLNIEYSYCRDDMDFDYDDILDKVKDVDALIIGNPNNPNGKVIDKEKFKPVLDFCEENKKIVIVDEAFIEFTGSCGMSFTYDASKYSCLFIIRALTKFFALPGIRFGYGISSNKCIVDRIKGRQNPWCVNCFAETAAKYVLKDEEYIKKSLKWIHDERKFMIDELKKIGIIQAVYPTYSNFVLCRLKGLDCNELYEKCLKNGVLIRRCENFRGLDKSYVRFAIKDRKKNAAFIEVLKNIK